MEQLYKSLVETHKKHKQPIILLGFSQGAMFACDLAYRYKDDPDCPFIGVVAIAPPYFSSWRVSDLVPCQVPLVLVTSPQDKNVSAKESQKWWAHFTTTHHYESQKGHKTHFPAELRNLVYSVFTPSNKESSRTVT